MSEPSECKLIFDIKRVKTLKDTMITIAIVYSHTSFFRVDAPGTPVTSMKYLSSSGGKWLHLDTNTSGNFKQSGKSISTISSKDVVNKKFYFIQGFINDKASPFQDQKAPTEPMPVKAGDRIQVLWTPNGHDGIKGGLQYYYRADYPTTELFLIDKYFGADFAASDKPPTVNMFDQTAFSDKAIQVKGKTVQCARDLKEEAYVKILGQKGSGRNDACASTITLPPSMNSGLQRIIGMWRIAGTTYIDQIFVNVGGTSSGNATATPVDTSTSTTGIPAIGQPNITDKPAKGKKSKKSSKTAKVTAVLPKCTN